MRKPVVTKEIIINVAEKIISEKGVDACTVRAVSKEADIASGTVYNYFPSRHAFLCEVFEHSWDKTKKSLELVINSALELKEKVLNFLEVIENDTINRRGIGKYVFKTSSHIMVNESYEYPVFEEIGLLFVELLKASPTNKDVIHDALVLDAKWIIFGYVSFCTNNKETSQIFTKEVLNRFFHL